jgi:hypothetical protein
MLGRVIFRRLSNTTVDPGFLNAKNRESHKMFDLDKSSNEIVLGRTIN